MFDILTIAKVLGAFYLGASILMFGFITLTTGTRLSTKAAMSLMWPLILTMVSITLVQRRKINKESERYLPYVVAINRSLSLTEIEKENLRKGVYNSMRIGIFPPVVVSESGDATSLEALGVYPIC